MFGKILDHFEEMLGALVMAVMVTLAFANVVTRYVIVYPLAFTEEITISMFVWLTLLGISIGVRSGAHLSVTFVYDLVSPSLRKIFFYIATGMSVLFFSLLAYLGSMQVWDEWELGATTDSLAIPSAFYSAGVPVFSLLIIFRVIQAAAKTVRERSY